MAKPKRLTLVRSTPAVQLPKIVEPATPYGWQAQAALNHITFRTEDTYLMYQAQSCLGRKVSIEEARELFTRIDIHTRQPIEPAKPKSWLARLLGL